VVGALAANEIYGVRRVTDDGYFDACA
jgi:hypothetical protein